MSWMREWLTHHAGQCKSVEDMTQEMTRMRRTLRRKDVVDGSQDQMIRMLEVENGELRLYLAALIWLLLDSGVITQEALVNVAEAVDRSDGKADGRYTGDIAAWGVGDGE